MRHCEERKRRSNPDASTTQDWIASLTLAMTSSQTRPHLPAPRFAPGVLQKTPPLEVRGHRECRMRKRTRSLMCKIKKAHEQVTTGSPAHRHSLRNGFNGLLRALPGDRAFLSPSPRNASHCRELTPASRCQDHTASPSADPAHAMRGTSGHRTLPRVRGDRERPSWWDRMARASKGDLPVGARGQPRQIGTTGKRETALARTRGVAYVYNICQPNTR